MSFPLGYSFLNYLFIYWGAINIGSTYTKNVNLGSAAAGNSNMGGTALE